MSELIEAPKPVQYSRARGQVIACPPGWELKSAGDMYDVAARAAHVACFHPAALGQFIMDRAPSKWLAMRIYVDNKNRRITAIFDDADQGYEALRRDRASHTAELSEEYLWWKHNDRQWKSKNDFLTLLEDREGDISNPKTAELRTVINELRLKKKVSWENTEKPVGAADVTLEFKTETDQIGEVKMPEMLTLTIPIFRDGDKYGIEVRLRFQIEEGKLQLQYCLPGTQHIVDQAWTESILPFAKQAKDAGWAVYSAQAPDEQKV